jgi:hypothetical protein
MATYPYTNYQKYMDPARRRYFEMITGGMSPQDFVSGQVSGVAAGIQPYIRQAGSQYAADLGGRGGAGGGAGLAYQSGLTGQKIGALAGARGTAQQQLLNVGQQATGFGQREAFQLTADQIAAFRNALEERRVKLSEEQLRMLKAQFPWMFAGDVLGAGAQAAGYAFGGG